MIALGALSALTALTGSVAQAAQRGAKLSIVSHSTGASDSPGTHSTGASHSSGTLAVTTPTTPTTPATTPPSAQAGPPAGAPVAVSLVALPRVPRVGQLVRLTVVDPPPGATGYVWDLLGHAVYQRRLGPGWHTDTLFRSAGTHPVAVRFTVGGVVHSGVMQLTVAPAGASHSGTPGAAYSSAAGGTHSVPPSSRRASGAHSAGGLSSRRTSGAHPAGGLSSRRASGAHPAASLSSRRGARSPAARTAGDPGVTIADFHFSPSATTVHVGDTITWTNNGPSGHTATAGDGSFDTGVLQKGQSASHTFTKAGTFAYVCRIHPFMHGTIVVLAGTSPSSTQPTQTPAASTAQTTTASPAAAAATGQPTLPNTGMNVIAGLLAGLALLGLGAALRRTLAR
jgi:LPXTG-motif cell wall-anchored protein